MASVNKVILVGNLGKDPEVRFTPSGRAVAKFPLATTDSWTDQENSRQERTEWHTSWCGASKPNLVDNTSPKVAKCMLRVQSVRGAMTTRKATSAISPKLWRNASSFLEAVVDGVRQPRQRVVAWVALMNSAAPQCHRRMTFPSKQVRLLQSLHE